MKSLDIYTLLLMGVFMSAGLSIILFSVHRSFRTEVQGIRHWAFGQVVMLVAAALLPLRGNPPGLAGVVGYNGALLLGMGLSLIGTQLFFGRRPDWRQLLGVIGAALLCLAWWQAVTPDYSARVAVGALAETWIHLMQAWLVWRHGERHFSSYFFLGLLLLHSAMTMTRGTAALLLGDTSVDFLSGPLLVQAYLAIATLLVLLQVVAFIVLAARRMQLVLEGRAARDPMTGALNRRGCAAFYERLQLHGRQSDRPLAVLAIDLDYFKKINDSHGHAVGDQVLVHVAQVVRAALRECDQLARLGGEEFVALLPGTSAGDAMAAAARMQAALRCHVGELPRCTVSIGAASQLDAAEDLDSLLRRADAALYRAKRAGRDRAELAELGNAVLSAGVC